MIQVVVPKVCSCGHRVDDHDLDGACLVEDCDCSEFFALLSVLETSILVLEETEGKFFGNQFLINPWIPPSVPKHTPGVLAVEEISVLSYEHML